MRIELETAELSENSQPKLLYTVFAITLSPVARTDQIDEQNRVELENSVPIIVTRRIRWIESAPLFDVCLKPVKQNSVRVILVLRFRERTRRNQC